MEILQPTSSSLVDAVDPALAWERVGEPKLDRGDQDILRW